MENIKLVTDSTVDLSKELIEELDLEVIPLYVSFEDDSKTYLDGIDISQNDVVDHVKRTGKLPTTSCAGPGVFAERFNKIINEGKKIIYCGIGSKLSSNYNSVILGKDECIDPSMVTVIDSNNLSSATGLCLLKIRDFLNEGMSVEEIKEKIETEIAPNIHTSFCMNNVDYMVKGGRCSALTGFFARILSIKPIIIVENGKLILGKTPLGSLNNAIKSIYNELQKIINEVDDKYIMVTHFLSDECANFIIPILKQECNFKNIYNTPAGSVIGSHCGPGTIGLLYIAKPNKEN